MLQIQKVSYSSSLLAKIIGYMIERPEWRYFLLIFMLHIISMALTLFAAMAISSPFSFWFTDTSFVIEVATLYLLLLGLFWDGGVIFFGMLVNYTRDKFNIKINPILSLENSRSLRFFSNGIPSICIVLMTCLAIMGTSNITLLSFKLLSNVTEWRDHIFWAIEEPLFVWLSTLSINTTFWDSLYHSCWPLEMAMVCFLIIVSQGSRMVFFYGFSMIILYYMGRFVGILNPLKGPAFYKPEYFNHKEGSLTQMAVERLNNTLAMPPEQAVDHGGILLGGISAMPSLHIGMVVLTSYWMYLAKKWTLFATIPWVVMVWISTVVLGWHYVVDGIGGVLLAIFSIWATRYLLSFSWGGLAKNL